MEKIPQMVDLAMTDEERRDNMPQVMGGNEAGPKYPYGLAISFDNDVLEKLGVDISDWEIGNLFHLFCMAKVTSKSENDTTDGKKCRVELQIVAIGAESEDEENEEMEEAEETPEEEKAEQEATQEQSPGKKRRNMYF